MTFAKSIRLAGVAVATVAALVLVGCSGGGGGGQTSAPDEDRTLRLSLQAPPSNFSIGSWSGGDATLFLSVYDTLVHRELDGSLAGGIAEEWEYNEDLTELTLHIRDGVEFTNGETLDAQAVVDSLEVAREGSSTSANLASVSAVEAVDDATVLITLSQPDAAIIPAFSSSVGAIGAPEVLTAESSQLEPVGSGPYTLNADASTAGSKYVLERNDDFYAIDKYPYSTVEVQIIPDPTAVQNALRAGQLDYAGLSSASQAAQFPAADFTTGNNLPGALGVLWLVDREGAVVPALGDERVRQAINLALDREGMAEGLGAGFMNATEQIFSPSGGAYSDALNGTYDFDVAEAKSLMAEAGYADGFDVTMPSTVVSTQFEATLTQSLGDIGIRVTWESVPFQDFYAKVFGGSYGMFFMYNGFGGSDSQDYNASMSGVFNPFHSTTPELETLAAEANVSQDADAYGALNEYLVDNAWFAPLVYVTSLYAVPNTVTYTPPVVGNQTVQPFAPAD